MCMVCMAFMIAVAPYTSSQVSFDCVAARGAFGFWYVTATWVVHSVAGRRIRTHCHICTWTRLWPLRYEGVTYSWWWFFEKWETPEYSELFHYSKCIIEFGNIQDWIFLPTAAGTLVHDHTQYTTAAKKLILFVYVVTQAYIKIISSFIQTTSRILWLKCLWIFAANAKQSSHFVCHRLRIADWTKDFL